MPNIKSQKDRVAQSKKEAAHNKAIKSNLKTVVKKADAAIDSNAENKDAAIKVAVSALDAAKNEVANGNMTGTVLNDAKGQATQAVASMEELLGGKTFEANHQSVYVDYVKVTPDNVKDFQ